MTTNKMSMQELIEFMKKTNAANEAIEGPSKAVAPVLQSPSVKQMIQSIVSRPATQPVHQQPMYEQPMYQPPVFEQQMIDPMFQQMLQQMAQPVISPATVKEPVVNTLPTEPIAPTSTTTKNDSNEKTVDSNATKGEITLTPEQNEAVSKIIHWFKNTNKQTFELAGYAGTGKSTVVDFVLSNLNIRPEDVHMCAPTGTASLVLKSKTPDYESSTLHRAIYTLDDTVKDYPRFVPNHEGLQGIKLLVVDESSMIGVNMGKDLLDVARSSNTRVLIIGDPGQLPPVSDGGQRAFLDNPDFMLTKIMRQAEDNKIIEASMKIRNNQWQHPENNIKVSDELMLFNRNKVDNEKLYNVFAKCIQNGGGVIVGVNKTRKAITERVRKILGFHLEGVLMEGEKIVIKQNIDLTGSDYIYSGDIDMLTNGMIGTVSNVEDHGYYYTFTFKADKFNLTVKKLELRKDVLNEKVKYIGTGYGTLHALLKQLKREGVKEIKGINAIFGYISTCHTAQGSQWDTVYVVDESATFQEEASRWLYTAVTRAAKRLVIVKSVGSSYNNPTPSAYEYMEAPPEAPVHQYPYGANYHMY